MNSSALISGSQIKLSQEDIEEGIGIISTLSELPDSFKEGAIKCLRGDKSLWSQICLAGALRTWIKNSNEYDDEIINQFFPSHDIPENEDPDITLEKALSELEELLTPNICKQDDAAFSNNSKQNNRRNPS